MRKRPRLTAASANLNVEAFEGKTVPQPDPVAAATAGSPGERRTQRKAARSAAATPPSRLGKVQIVAWTTEDTRARLKAKAALERRSVDEILNAAIAAILKAK